MRKEDEFVVLAFIGALVALTAVRDRDRLRFGCAVAAIGIGGALAYFLVIRHALRSVVGSWSFHYYDWSRRRVAERVRAARLAAPAAVPGRGAGAAGVPAAGLGATCCSRSRFVEALASHEAVTLAIGAHYTRSVGLRARPPSRYERNAAGESPAGRRIALLAAFAAGFGITKTDPMGMVYLYRPPTPTTRCSSRRCARYRGAPASVRIRCCHLGTDPTATVTMTGQPWFVFDETQFSPQWRDVDEPKVRTLLRSGAYRKCSIAMAWSSSKLW